MSNGLKIEFHCEHVAKNHVHCNRYTIVPNVGKKQPPSEAIERTDWSFVDGDVRCPQHS